MPRWSIDMILRRGTHLGTVEAPDERSAIAKAAEQFEIAPALRNKIAVTKINKSR